MWHFIPSDLCGSHCENAPSPVPRDVKDGEALLLLLPWTPTSLFLYLEQLETVEQVQRKVMLSWVRIATSTGTQNFL
ncbi:hypothetical protein Nepgr_008281 [Nepenthes gracilis]|uniref:Uncharacterized protein n=1 Tax=Nepenthes gracilis TaxID=150966 RepID=A0AAD3S9G4_NEPGR|nr:hypothetical protein Nepgr_008281 [Nepenthes gracilis]